MKTEKIHCERCGEMLTYNRIVWLELDTNTGLFFRDGEFPKSGKSQGLFPFGKACAHFQLGEKTQYKFK